MEGERIALGYMYVQLMNRCETLALPSVPSVFCRSKVLLISLRNLVVSRSRLSVLPSTGRDNASLPERGAKVHAKGAYSCA